MVLGLVFIVLLCAVVAAIGLAGSSSEPYRHLLPLLPYIIIHMGALRAPASMPSWLVFATGLGMDFVTHGPLGYWALIYLSGLFCLHMAPDGLLRTHVGRTVLSIATVGILVALQFGVSSVYVMQVIDAQPLVQAAGTALAVLVVLEWVLPVWSDRPRSYGGEAVVLERGE